jgi:hypothetical protein
MFIYTKGASATGRITWEFARDIPDTRSIFDGIMAKEDLRPDAEHMEGMERKWFEPEENVQLIGLAAFVETRRLRWYPEIDPDTGRPMHTAITLAFTILQGTYLTTMRMIVESMRGAGEALLAMARMEFALRNLGHYDRNAISMAARYGRPGRYIRMWREPRDAKGSVRTEDDA